MYMILFAQYKEHRKIVGATGVSLDHIDTILQITKEKHPNADVVGYVAVPSLRNMWTEEQVSHTYMPALQVPE